MNVINVKWLVTLACAAGWTTFFSFFNAPRVRGLRNFGWMTCFVLGLLMMVVLPWRSALATWALAGVASGLFYFAYECYAFVTTNDKSEASRPSLWTIVNGLYLWPIMLPEAVEYWLADLGVLKAPSKPRADEGSSSSVAEQPREEG